MVPGEFAAGTEDGLGARIEKHALGPPLAASHVNQYAGVRSRERRTKSALVRFYHFIASTPPIISANSVVI